MASLSSPLHYHFFGFTAIEYRKYTHETQIPCGCAKKKIAKIQIYTIQAPKPPAKWTRLHRHRLSGALSACTRTACCGVWSRGVWFHAPRPVAVQCIWNMQRPTKPSVLSRDTATQLTGGAPHTQRSEGSPPKGHAKGRTSVEARVEAFRIASTRCH